MRTIAVLLLLGASIAGAAQNAPAGPSEGSAPPQDVDAALRDRVTRFFQAQANGKYRQADQYVAEDTKDYFYVMYKTPITKFEIAKISYSDNFTKAAVTVRTEREFAEAMIPKMKLTNREISDWKIENGLWCWTVDQTVIKTPFGEMRPGTGPAGTGSGATPEIAVPSVADMTKTVAADKSEVELGERKSDQVVFLNSLPGPITLSLDAPQTPGLEVKLDRSAVASNGTARVLLSYDPSAAGAKEGTVAVNVVVQPTQQVIPIQVKLKPGGAAK
jgi:hypothetical protein